MSAEDVSIPKLNQKKRNRRCPRKVRDELSRTRRALDKAQREAHGLVIEDFEEQVQKGCDESLLTGKGRTPNLMIKLRPSAQNPSSSITAEASNPEVEWVASRTTHAKRSARGLRKIFSH